MQQTVLVTGGAGYIGSHTVLELLLEGYKIVVVDDLSNARDGKLVFGSVKLIWSTDTLERIEKFTGKPIIFHQINITDKEALDAVFSHHVFDAVIHFAAFKAISEANKDPLS